MNGSRLYFLGIVGLLVAAGAGAGGQFVLPGASHARLPGASYWPPCSLAGAG